MIKFQAICLFSLNLNYMLQQFSGRILKQSDNMFLIFVAYAISASMAAPGNHMISVSSNQSVNPPAKDAGLFLLVLEL